MTAAARRPCRATGCAPMRSSARVLSARGPADLHLRAEVLRRHLRGQPGRAGRGAVRAAAVRRGAGPGARLAVGAARRRRAALAVAGGAALLALSMIGLFAVTPPIAPLWWFALTLTGLFTAFSFLTISFYAAGRRQGGRRIGPAGHVRLAGWRETGALLGVCVAAVAPTLLHRLTGQPFAVFALGFAAWPLVAALAHGARMAAAARASDADADPRASWPTPLARRLLLICAGERDAGRGVLDAVPVLRRKPRWRRRGGRGRFWCCSSWPPRPRRPVWCRLARALRARSRRCWRAWRWRSSPSLCVPDARRPATSLPFAADLRRLGRDASART